MHFMKITVAVLSLTAAAFAVPAAAQPTDTTSNSWRMPYQSEFWTTGHVGAGIGRARSDIPCPPGGACDSTANAFKVFAGGRFNNVLGGEVTYLKTGAFDRSPSGDIDMQALNFGALLGVPLIVEGVRVRIELKDEGIAYRGLLRSYDSVPWNDIDVAAWSPSMKWLVLTTRHGDKLRVSAMLNGLDALALALGERAPTLRMNDVTRQMLADARAGKLPNIWQ